MSLTDNAIKGAKAPEKPVKLWDTLGLYLHVTPRGGKWWRFRYRVGASGARREKLLSLGTYPDVSLKQARAKRDQMRVLLANGVDPGAARKAGSTGSDVTFKMLADEWLELRRPGWKKTHTKTVEARLKNDILPHLGTRPVDQVTSPEALDVIRRIEARGANESARRVRSIIGLICKYAVATGRATTDPTAALTADVLAASPTNHYPAPLDPVEIGRILRALDGYKGSPIVRAAVQMGPLVFVRPGELRNARWDDLDFDEATWMFTASKTGQPHIVPLARQVVTIIEELRPLTGEDEWVFPGRDRAKPMSDTAVIAAYRRCDIGKDELVGHSWRAIARTLLVERLGYPAEVVELQLAHAVKDPNGRAYNRVQWLDKRVVMMTDWADFLDGLVSKSG